MADVALPYGDETSVVCRGELCMDSRIHMRPYCDEISVVYRDDLVPRFPVHRGPVLLW